MEQLDFWIRYFNEHIGTDGYVELDSLDSVRILEFLKELKKRRAKDAGK
jgi:hypothetical protein